MVFVEVTLVVRVLWAWEEKMVAKRNMPNKSEMNARRLTPKSYERIPKNQGAKCDKSMSNAIRYENS